MFDVTIQEIAQASTLGFGFFMSCSFLCNTNGPLPGAMLCFDMALQVFDTR
jgi:hypothetical protein